MAYTGGNRQYVVTSVPYPVGVAVTQQFIFYADQRQKRIVRLDKHNITDRVVMKKALENIYELDIYDEQLQPKGR